MKPRPYQSEYVDFAFGKPGVLCADGMGTGKTASQLFEIKEALEDGVIGEDFKALIFTRNGAKRGWERHFRLILPDAPVVRMPTGATRERRAKIAQSYDTGFLLAHYETLPIVPQYLSTVWDYIICDEVHNVNNRKAKRTKALKKLRTRYKRGLSGTPMVNRPDELWSILNWFDPKTYSSYWRFYKEYCQYERHPEYGYYIFLGPDNVPKLRAELRDRMIRRTKEQVLPDLPAKLPRVYRTVPMASPQARAYKEMKRESLAWIGPAEDEAVPAPTVLAQLTRLRQFADAYCYIDDDGTVRMQMPSPKVSDLLDIVKDSDDQIVVWSQFREMVNLAYEQLIVSGISACRIIGGQSDNQRDEAIEGFIGGRYRVLVGVMQAGGEGIDGLQLASSTCVFLDRAWTPKDNEQAEDRLHRDGQTKPVEIIILQSEGTVDRRVEKKLEFKRSMIRRIIDGVDEEPEEDAA